MRDRSGELDVSHAVAPHLGTRDLDAAPLADDALEPDALVLAAVALPVPGGTEDPLAEQAVFLRLQGPVVDGLGLLHLAVGPHAWIFIRGGKTDPKLIEEVHIQHVGRRLLELVVAMMVNARSFPFQSKSAPAGSRRLRSIPSSSAARKTSSSAPRSSSSPDDERTSTFKQSDCISLIKTLKDSGIPGSGCSRPSRSPRRP